MLLVFVFVDTMAQDRSPDLFAHQFYVLFFIFFCFSYSYVRQSFPAIWSTFGRTVK